MPLSRWRHYLNQQDTEEGTSALKRIDPTSSQVQNAYFWYECTMSEILIIIMIDKTQTSDQVYSEEAMANDRLETRKQS